LGSAWINGLPREGVFAAAVLVAFFEEDLRAGVFFFIGLREGWARSSRARDIRPLFSLYWR
jgi:hypothetical protein